MCVCVCSKPIIDNLKVSCLNTVTLKIKLPIWARKQELKICREKETLGAEEADDRI